MTSRTRLHLSRREWLAAAALGAALPAARAQSVPIKFQLDWRFEGNAALFTVPAARGYFKDEKLDVTVDAGNGSAAAISRVASGAYDIASADMAALMEFYGNNPDTPNKPVAVMMIYSNTPAAVMMLKKSGITKPTDLGGKNLGAPIFDGGRKAWPIFAQANRIGPVTWTSMDPPLRETMLVRGDVDAITGYAFTSLLNLEARGVKAQDVTLMAYKDYGVKQYGNAVIVSPQFLDKHPEAVRGFLRAYTRGVKEVIANPKAAIETVKARDGIINPALEERRLAMVLDMAVLTADARAEGFGAVDEARLRLMASQLSDTYKTKVRVDAARLWNASFLPSAQERDVFKSLKKK